MTSIKSGKHSGNSLYIGKASDDLLRRPIEETQAYADLNEALEKLELKSFRYRIEILPDEDHYRMSIPGILHGLETIYPRAIWNIPYPSFWKAEKPAETIKKYFDGLSLQYGFEIVPNEDAFYFIGNLSGVGRRLRAAKRYPELVELLELAADYYPKSAALYRSLSKA
ncbi:MAG: hypothetical protein AAGC45_02745 [Bacteroidota bacterium]